MSQAGPQIYKNVKNVVWHQTSDVSFYGVDSIDITVNVTTQQAYNNGQTGPVASGATRRVVSFNVNSNDMATFKSILLNYTEGMGIFNFTQDPTENSIVTTPGATVTHTLKNAYISGGVRENAMGEGFPRYSLPFECLSDDNDVLPWAIA